MINRRKPNDAEYAGWMETLRKALDKDCPDCTHSLWAHGDPDGCCIYITKDLKITCPCKYFRTNSEIIKNDYYFGNDPFEEEDNYYD